MKNRVGFGAMRTIAGLNGLLLRWYALNRFTVGLNAGVGLFSHRDTDEDGNFDRIRTVGVFGVGPEFLFWPAQGDRSQQVHADFGLGLRITTYVGFLGNLEEEQSNTLDTPLEIDIEIPAALQLFIGQRVAVLPEFGVVFRVIPGDREPDLNGEFDMNPGREIGSRRAHGVVLRHRVRVLLRQTARVMEELIRALPKVELHLHIEGTLEPELMLELAARNGVELPFADVDDVRAAYEFDGLQSFLDLYYRGASVLVTEDDFDALAWAYFQRAHADHVRHAEVFFDPQTHTSRGVAMETVVQGLARAQARARDELGITSLLILCFLRHLSAAAAMETLEQALALREHIVGVGLDSTELGHPPEKFVGVFERARDEGLRTVAHAGEEGPPSYIAGAIDALYVDRIDHGIRCTEDPALVSRLARLQMPLTVCPLSNIRLKVFDSFAEHNLLTLLEHGLRVTLNSDDPAYFGGYLTENFLQCWRALNLTRSHLHTLAGNAIEASFAPDDRKRALRRELDVFFG
jgi:adenosine deaminase